MAGPTIWNSNLVAQTLEKLRLGIQTDLSCFHTQDIELKAANILYQLTPEEQDEFYKCSHDIYHFVSKYCRFLTDAGRVTVKLRDFQENILESLSEEMYSEKLDEFVPVTRNMIMMQSRQSGKCFLDATILLQYPNGNMYKVPINIFYYMQKGKLSLIEKIKIKFYIWRYILNN